MAASGRGGSEVPLADDQSRVRVIVKHGFMDGFADVPDEMPDNRPPSDPRDNRLRGQHHWGQPLCELELEGRTTVMIKNIPDACDPNMLVTLLENQGFGGWFDFVYRPFQFDKKKWVGYALVNLWSSLKAQDLKDQFDGFVDWGVEGGKPAVTAWYKEHGKENHIKRYRDSPIMHPNVADIYKPMVFQSGVKEPFPPPSDTEKLMPPKKTKRRMHGRRHVCDTASETGLS